MRHLHTFEPEFAYCAAIRGYIPTRNLFMHAPDGEKIGRITWDGERYHGSLDDDEIWVVSKDLKQVEQAMLRKVAEMYGSLKDAA